MIARRPSRRPQAESACHRVVDPDPLDRGGAEAESDAPATTREESTPSMFSDPINPNCDYAPT